MKASMKKCFKCNQLLSLSEFYKHPKMSDGHLNKCKSCTKKDVHDHRHGKGRETVLSYDKERARTTIRKEAAKLQRIKWLEQYPERRQAQVIVGNAVRDGHLVPWPVCAVPECNCKPEAHHPDYSKPLDVTWLCPAHHKQAHALIKDHYDKTK